MTISAGTRLGPYEIVAPLGAGGMGEVWKARDTRLERNVAIKVLPESLAANVQFRQRFEREAKTISQLNHPHICTLYDVGDDYLVMELLEGESLADRVARGPLPVEDVLRYGIQIAEALDKAHRAGVVHRDLKPGNVMLTKSGAKLLDFGLAKSSAFQIDADGATQQKPLTQEGTILGTFQYMAPEQLEGLEADPRSDVFALGAVLYEMATGCRAFDGKTKTSLIAAIVREQPRPISEVRPLTPPALQHVVDKCLAKEADERWQSAYDIASELRWISGAGSQAGVATKVAMARTRRHRGVTAAAIAGWVVAVAAGIGALLLTSKLREARPLTYVDLAQQVASTYDTLPVAVSPDGRQIAMIVPSGNTTQLSLRELSHGEMRLLSGTEGALYPFWAPDGRTVGFFASGKLKAIALDSGAVQIIADAPSGRGGAWSPSGIIVFAPTPNSALYKVSENGGTPVAVTKLPPHATATHRNPVFTADGKHFLYAAAVAGTVPDQTIRAGSIEGNFDRKVLDYASTATIVGEWLLTVRDGNLMAQRFDSRNFSVSGNPVPLAQHIDWYGPKFNAAFAASSGTLVLQHATHPRQQFYLADSETSVPAAAGEPGWYAQSALSPDARRVVANRYDPLDESFDLWMFDVAGNASQRITNVKGSGVDLNFATFSPDGQQLAISVESNDGVSRIWRQPLGGGSQQAVKATAAYGHVSDWSRDGRTMLVVAQGPAETVDIDGRERPLPALTSNAELNGSFSPDGKWIAYDSNESGRSEVYVTSYPQATSKLQVSSGGAWRPFWSPDGSKLYFLTEGHIVAAAVHSGESFSTETARPISAFGDHIADFAVSRNGRFLILRELDPGASPLSIVFNWRKLLESR